ncbi:571_t:CDS:1 [Diversispora eburnea]|uniref:571_t:CDS:1 n=1 Tax=Diversispora eburnea TaxID=1213867 RepID=A0A9N9BCI9_9GLOM|nr:571_t:CDS:1 [Diversispora eburnea]
MNNVTNIRYLSTEINGAEGIYFRGYTVKDPNLLNAVKDYLAMDDVYNAFSITRSKMINLFRKVVNENGLNVPNFDNIDTFFGRSEYENLTGRTLTSQSFNNFSSTLPLPYLPVILSIILSLVFMVFGGCSQKITRKSIPHIKKNDTYINTRMSIPHITIH